MGLRTVPATFADAKAFVAAWHRHHRPPVGHRFSIGVAAGDVLVGVAVVGRPVARHLDDGPTLEIVRLATDGTRNACSVLYAAGWQATRALGYRRLVTYTRADEGGASLRAASWRVVAARPPSRGWSRPSQPRTGHTTRLRWQPDYPTACGPSTGSTAARPCTVHPHPLGDPTP